MQEATRTEQRYFYVQVSFIISTKSSIDRTNLNVYKFGVDTCRGNTPFCSEECRQEQIETDEAKERPWNMSRTLRKADVPKKSGSVRTGALVVA